MSELSLCSDILEGGGSYSSLNGTPRHNMQQHLAHGKVSRVHPKLFEIALGIFWLQIISHQEDLQHRKQPSIHLKRSRPLPSGKYSHSLHLHSGTKTHQSSCKCFSLCSIPGILSDKGNNHLLHSPAIVSLNRLVRNDRRGILLWQASDMICFDSRHWQHLSGIHASHLMLQVYQQKTESTSQTLNRSANIKWLLKKS